jgi:hypothetical protein
MGRPFRALRHVTAWQSFFDIGLGVHFEPVSLAVSSRTREISNSHRLREPRGLYGEMIS